MRLIVLEMSAVVLEFRMMNETLHMLLTRIKARFLMRFEKD
jgi:hypothetical protein